MRGKLRDKRADTKRDNLKRDVVTRRRAGKRDNRNMTWLNEQIEENDETLLDEQEDLPVEEAKK